MLKNNRYYLSIFGFILTIFFNSCTVQKRLHSSGYSVNWKQRITTQSCHSNDNQTDVNSNVSNSSQIARTEKQAIQDDREQVNSSSILSNSNPEARFLNDDIAGQENIEKTISSENSTSKLQSKRIENKSISDLPNSEENKTRIIEPHTWSCLASGLGVILCSFLLFLPGLELLGFSLMAILSVLSIVFGVISVIKIRKNPEVYKLKWLTYLIAFASLGALLYSILWINAIVNLEIF